MRYVFTAVYVEAPEGGIIAYVEELPDVHAQGETLAEARATLRAAIDLTLACNRRDTWKRHAAAPVVRRETVTLSNPGSHD